MDRQRSTHEWLGPRAAGRSSPRGTQHGETEGTLRGHSTTFKELDSAQTSSCEDARRRARKADETHKAVASLERRVLTAHDKGTQWQKQCFVSNGSLLRSPLPDTYQHDHPDPSPVAEDAVRRAYFAVASLSLDFSFSGDEATRMAHTVKR